MKKFLLAIVLALCSVQPALATGPYLRFYQNIKLPSQAVLQHDTITNPAASSDTKLSSGATTSSTASSVLSTFTVQPDVPRNITITPTGSILNVLTGTAVVAGLNMHGVGITENFAVTASTGSKITGNSAFRSVSSVTFPQVSAAGGVTFSVGTGTKLGLIRCMNNAGDVDFSEFGGVYDTTRGTVAVSTTSVEKNTFIDNSAPDGAHNVDVFYIDNFRCY